MDDQNTTPEDPAPGKVPGDMDKTTKTSAAELEEQLAQNLNDLERELEDFELPQLNTGDEIEALFEDEMLDMDIAQALDQFDFDSPEEQDQVYEADDDDILEVNEISGIFNTSGVFALVGEGSIPPFEGVIQEEPPTASEHTKIDAFEASGLLMLENARPISADDAESEQIIEIDPLSDDFEILQEIDVHEVQQQATAAFIAGHEREGFRIILESLGRRLALQEPWASWAAELRLDALAEHDAMLRASYLYLFAMMLRLHGEAGRAAAKQLEAQLAQGGQVLRSFLLEQLAGVWGQSEVAFMDQFELLREHDEVHEVPDAEVRHLSIAAARLIGNLGKGQVSGAKLLEWVSQSEGALSLMVEVLFAHKRSDRLAASGYWRRIADYVSGSMHDACLTLAGYLLHDRTRFFEQLGAVMENPAEVKAVFPKPLLYAMKYSSCWQGEYKREAKVLEYLLSQDDVSGPVSDQAAQWARLGLLKHTFDNHQDRSKRGNRSNLSELLKQAFVQHREEQTKQDALTTGIEAMRKAQQLDPSRLEYALLLEQFARHEQDKELLLYALEAQVGLVEDPAIRALLREQAAWSWANEHGWDKRAKRMLEYGLEESNESLPLLLTLGHLHVQKSDWTGVMKVRSQPDVGGTLTSAWRRANLLEQSGGDPREILSLYRSARHKEPENVHLYFGVERSLANLGLWRGMINLFENISKDQPEFAQELLDNGLDLDGFSCAVEMYLEDGPLPDISRLEAYLERHKETFLKDAIIFYRVLAHRVRKGDLDGVLGDLELLIERASRNHDPVDRNRAMLWKAYLQGWHLKEEEAAVRTLRQIFLDAQRPVMVRFAFHALLRFDDHGWLAEQLGEQEASTELLASALELDPERRDAVMVGLAAELMAQGGAKISAAQLLVESPSASLANLWRALGWTAKSQDWEAVAKTILSTKLMEERGLWDLALYLDAASDRPGNVLEHIEGRDFDDVALLMALESAMRHGDTKKCASILRAFQEFEVLATRGWSAALGFFGTSLAEWVEHDDEHAIEQARRWSEMLTEETTELDMLCMLGSWYRMARRLGLDEEVEEVSGTIRELFAHEFVEIFDQEVALREKSSSEVASWYEKRASEHRKSAQEEDATIISYLRLAGAWFGWLKDPVSVESLDNMLDLSELPMESPALIQWAGIIASRQLNLQDETLRRLEQFVSLREEPGFASWGHVRTIMHLGVGMRQLGDGLARVARARVTRDRPALRRLEEVLVLSMDDPSRESRLAEESAYVTPTHSQYLSLLRALILKDEDALSELAQEDHPAAVLWAEEVAAHERRDWRAEQNIELLYAALRTSRHGEPQDSVRRRFIRALEAGGESLIASPWCPLRLIQDDLAALGVSGGALDEIVNVARGFTCHDVSSHVRLVVARQLVRHGRAEQAMELIPDMFDTSLTGFAWSWLDDAYAEVEAEPEGLRLMRRIAFWRSRLGHTKSDVVGAPTSYEVAKLLEQVGEQGQAEEFYEQILEVMPDFAPAEIALVRRLQERQQWQSVVRVWSKGLEDKSNPKQMAAVAYRIGFVHERWLAGEADSQTQALDAYSVVLDVDPGHLPALTGALRITLQLGYYDRAADLLEKLIPICIDRQMRTAYWLQLASLYEQELGDTERALQAYESAYALDGTSDMAMLGILRTDVAADHEKSVHMLTERLEHATEQELTQGGYYLFLLTEKSSMASLAMRRFQPYNLSWRLVQIARGLEQGEVEEEAIGVVRQAAEYPPLKLVFMLLEQLHGAQSSVVSGEMRQVLVDEVGRDSLYEGVLVGMLSVNQEREDLGRQEMLAQALTRRASHVIDTASQWLKRVFLLRWSGRTDKALEEMEKLHERFPRFLPSTKFGRLLTQELQQWARFAHFAAREAELTHLPDLASKLRLDASEAQRRFVGDFGSAIAQLKLVLQNDPMHQEAFEKLKTLLVQANRFEDALALMDQRLTRTGDINGRLVLLNDMADVALGAMHDASRAIQYLNASIKLKPRQLRRLRILAELYESTAQYEQAIACYNAATRCCPDKRLTAKMLLQMGNLSERFLGNPQQADMHYQRLLGIDPENFEGLHARARIRKQNQDYQGALELIRVVERVARTPQEHKQARLSKLELVTLSNRDVDHSLAVAREVLLNHPDHVEAGELVRDLLKRVGRVGELEGFIRHVILDALSQQPNPQLGMFFTLARRLRLNDLAYCLAASLKWQGHSSRDVQSFHDKAKVTFKWPRSPVPPELTLGLLPKDLSVSIVEIMRRSSQGLTESCQPIPFGQLIKRKHRVSGPTGPMQELAWKWPGLFGLKLRDVYKVDKLPLGSAIVWDDGVRLLIDESWDSQDNAYALLLRLGSQLAAWSMGIGYWALLGREAQISLFTKLISSVSVSWSHQPTSKLPNWFSMDRFDKWVKRDGADLVAGYALELASQRGTQMLPEQFTLLELAMERLACVVLPDPERFLGLTMRLGVENGPAQRPWSFVLSQEFALLRKALGVSYEG